jgi:hypothetical protein
VLAFSPSRKQSVDLRMGEAMRSKTLVCTRAQRHDTHLIEKYHGWLMFPGHREETTHQLLAFTQISVTRTVMSQQSPEQNAASFHVLGRH